MLGKWLRRIVQVVCLFFFFWLLYHARWHPEGSIPPPLFLRADPLVALSAFLSRGSTSLPLFIPAGIIIVITVLFGRIFCGWICPLGTIIDTSDTILWRRRSGQRARYARPAWKYYVLGAALVAALFGVQLAWIADPIPLLTRTAATVFYPLTLGGYNLIVLRAQSLLRGWGLYLNPVAVPRFSLDIAVTAMFVAILLLGYFARRMWCRSLCPLGALFAFLGRFSLLKRYVSPTCTGCLRCAAACKMGAIPGDEPEKTYTTECILCYDCLVACPRPDASDIGIYPARAGGADPATRASKRAFLGALGAGVAYGLVARFGWRRPEPHPKLIRPPGANVYDPGGGRRRMTEEEFRAVCVRCGECMRACPTGGLQPATGQAEFDGLYTPILVSQVGFCEQNCNVCGEVCPSGALKPFTIQEKYDIRLGVVEINADTCLSWQRGSDYQLCLICAEVCSYAAIDNPVYEGQRRPFIDPAKCVGCGQCEYNCPTEPQRSIIVSRLP